MGGSEKYFFRRRPLLRDQPSNTAPQCLVAIPPLHLSLHHHHCLSCRYSHCTCQRSPSSVLHKSLSRSERDSLHPTSHPHRCPRIHGKQSSISHCAAVPELMLLENNLPTPEPRARRIGESRYGHRRRVSSHIADQCAGSPRSQWHPNPLLRRLLPPLRTLLPLNHKTSTFLPRQISPLPSLLPPRCWSPVLPPSFIHPP